MLNSPFLQAGATRSITNSLLKPTKFSFNGILTNLEKTVSTINQVVPLYNQVKPLISNSKTIINAFKSTKPAKESRNNNGENNNNIVNVDFKETLDNKKNETFNIFTTTTTPNKPFFN